MVASRYWPFNQAHEPNVRTCPGHVAGHFTLLPNGLLRAPQPDPLLALTGKKGVVVESVYDLSNTFNPDKLARNN